MASERMDACMIGLFLRRELWFRSSCRLKYAEANLEADFRWEESIGQHNFSSETSTADNVSYASSCGGSSCSSDDDISQEDALKRNIDLVLQETVEVQVWDDDKYEFQRSLQDAPRNFGTVDLVRRIDDGNFVAVKKIPNEWMTCNADEFQERHVDSEEHPWVDLAIMKYLERQNFLHYCKCLGVFRDATYTRIITSFASEGDLLAMCRWLPVPGDQRIRLVEPVMRETLLAVRDLHDLGVSHGDLSLENIVLAKDAEGMLHPKLIDFGMSGPTRFHNGPLSAKPSYTAPERHKDITWDIFLADGFALGVAFFVLMANDYPWSSTNPRNSERFQTVRQHGLALTLRKQSVKTSTGRKAICKVVAEPVLDVVFGLMELCPAQRLTLGEECWGPDERRRSVWDMTWLAGEHQQAS